MYKSRIQTQLDNVPCTLNLNQLLSVLSALKKTSKRDAAIAHCMAITASPMKEVLDCKCSDLSMHKGTLFGLQMGYECTCIIKEYLDERNSYQNNDSEFLFITKNGSQVCRTHITKKFSMVGKELGFKFRLVSRMIQWALVRYWMNHLPMEEVQEGIGTRKIPRLLKYTRYG